MRYDDAKDQSIRFGAGRVPPAYAEGTDPMFAFRLPAYRHSPQAFPDFDAKHLLFTDSMFKYKCSIFEKPAMFSRKHSGGRVAV
jgi:hypothetical protein